jgi:hypothetical protein
LLLSLHKAPRMYASTREALLMRVSTILEMVDDNYDARDLYEKHGSPTGNVYGDMDKQYEDEWARCVIDKALTLLPVVISELDPPVDAGVTRPGTE